MFILYYTAAFLKFESIKIRIRDLTVYLVGFLVSLTIVAIVQRWRKGSVGFVFWSCVAIAIPCLIAGLRGTSIGTDVTSYAQPLFNLAKSNSGFQEYWTSVWWRDGWHYAGPANFEVGYSLLAYLSARLFGSLQSFLFLTEAFAIVPIYIALAKYRERVPIALALCVYYLIFFNMSLNMMRQSIALGFAFLAIVGYYKSGVGWKGQLNCAVVLLIGTLFHVTALIGFVVLAIRLYLEGGKLGGTSLRRALIVCGLAIVLLLCIGILRNLMLSFGLTQYIQYLGSGSIGIKPYQILLRAPMFLLAAVLVFQKDRSVFDVFIFVMVTVGLILSQLTSLGTQSVRIAYYFSIFILCVPGALYVRFKENAGKLVLAEGSSIAYCISYWVFTFVISGSSETIPYLFYWM